MPAVMTLGVVIFFPIDSTSKLRVAFWIWGTAMALLLSSKKLK